MGWVSYRNNLKVVEEKIRQELTSLSSHSSRELDIWISEKQHDVRVFASSYEVSENLQKAMEPAGPGSGASLARLKDYLLSVQRRFPDYLELLALDRDGALVASSAEGATRHELPEGWESLAEAGKVIVGAPVFDDLLAAGVLLVAEPVRAEGARPLGLLAVKLDLRAIRKILVPQAQSGDDHLYVITNDGTVVGSYPELDGPPLSARYPASIVEELFARRVIPLEFVSLHGTEVVGTIEEIPLLRWGVVAEKSRAVEYAEIASLRNVTLVLVGVSLLGVGLAAWLLGLTLVRPLERLTSGAGKVAAGEMDVELPVYGRGEVGYLTVVFNRMVARLRKAREDLDATNRALVTKNEELHTISVTDGLTGLHNRKHMNETVELEFKRAERNGHAVSILMIDIDRFKNFNDARGHQAGDAVIRGVADVLKETIRTTDYAARYGGEEFLILLPYIGPDKAMQTGERLRAAVEGAKLGAADGFEGLTISVGAASYPECGSESEAIIREADLALYKAKRGGRNQVVPARAAWASSPEEPPS
jgi:diguanylate cyclase (GGDEF)-like protein